MKKTDKPIDWKDIEADYRAGKMSTREIARWHGISDTAVRKMAKKSGWERKSTPDHIVPEPVVVRTAVATVAPKDLGERGKALAGRMMDELDAVTSLHGELEDMICTEESDPRRRQALLKALSLGERAKTLKDLSLTLKTLNEASAPDGKKAQRQANAEQAASQGGRFAVRQGPARAASVN